ncbi:MAG: histidinol dehydrogenase [Candidatus Latescibacterota bacterium]
MLEQVAYPTEPLAPRLLAILGRRRGVPEEVEQAVRGTLRRVREGGDRALVQITAVVDRVALDPGRIRVPARDLERAAASLSPELAAAMAAAAANIRAFHEHQRLTSWFVEDGDGVILGKRVTPVRRAGICVPAGEAPLFSSLLMAAIPAQVAGVAQICVVSPPQASGLPHPVIMAAAHRLGIGEVYGVGGAQAVAALAYGTESIPAVDVIVGPGSPYTVAAQQQVFGLVGVAMLPGPSEIAVLADENADAGYVAADLLSQAEHGWDVACVCITPSASLAAGVQRQVASQLAGLPRATQAGRALAEHGAVVLVPDLERGAELLDRMAPEHAELLVREPWTWLDRVHNAGAVFLGPASPEPVGDYFAGTNHILPTNGAARYASSLGVASFLKTSSIVGYTQRRLERTGARIALLARAEGLEAHARAVEIRLAGGGNG